MSRKTLLFKSRVDIPDDLRIMLLSIRQETHRSGRQRVEIGKESVSWSQGSGAVSSKSEDEDVARTVNKKPRDQNPSLVVTEV